MVGEFLKSLADESGKLSNLIENALQRHGKLLVSTLTGHTEKCIEDVGEKLRSCYQVSVAYKRRLSHF